MNIFYCPTASYPALDIVNADGRGRYGGKTQAQLEAEHGPIEIVDDAECTRRIEASNITAPVEIDHDKFWYWLECLPPCKWYRGGNTEAFHISERITESIVTWCVRVGERYFSLQDTDKLLPKQAIEKVQSKFFPCVY